MIGYPVVLARCIGGGDHVPLRACCSGTYKRITRLNGVAGLGSSSVVHDEYEQILKIMEDMILLTYTCM